MDPPKSLNSVNVSFRSLSHFSHPLKSELCGYPLGRYHHMTYADDWLG